MAIYHFSGTVISRSQGRSAVACAAYRAGERLVDERYETEHDYTRKQDVIHQEILLPQDAPAWMAQREKLWNAVEAHEKRKDAQLSREFNFALPKELTATQNLELVRTFVKEQFVSQGMVADLCIHLDKNQAGESLPHAHVMLTLRTLTAAGFGAKVRAWNDKALLLTWRESWAETVNHYLALNGHDLQIDHRTLEAQGIDLEPQHKIGSIAASDRMARLADHQRIAKENGERLWANPAIAFKALTAQQSTFTHQDLARFVNRHSVDAQQFEKVYERLKGDKALVFLGKDLQNRERFTTQEMLQLESSLLKKAELLSQNIDYVVSQCHQTVACSSRTLSESQQAAFWYLLEPQGLRCLIGYAGTGKSYLLGAARTAWEATGYKVHGVTLSGIAAETLEASSGIASRTLASRCYYWDKGEQCLGAKDILVVDEAGMLGSRQMQRLLSEAVQGGAKVVLVGDPQQLQAIEAGAAFRAITQQASFLELTEIRRQEIAWQRAATLEFAEGKVGRALDRYQSHDHIHAFQTQAVAKQGLIKLWNDVRLAQPQQSQIILAYTRAEVEDLNAMARECRHRAGELGIEQCFQMERGERWFAPQDRLYFLKNDRQLGVMNGTLGTLETMANHQWQVRLDPVVGEKARVVNFDLRQYNHLDHGYAATIHKAQGVTVDRSYILASRYLDLHATYVGMTRHRTSSDLFYSLETFPRLADLSKTLGRERAKDISLDYGFSQARGIEFFESPEKKLEITTKVPALSERAKNPKLSDRLSKPPPSLKRAFDPLKTFKDRFEAEHPVRAKQLGEATRPHHEKAALEIQREFTRLEKQLEKESPSAECLKALQEKACAALQNPEIMDFLKRNHMELSQKIEQLAQQTPQKTLGLRLTTDNDRGISR